MTAPHHMVSLRGGTTASGHDVARPSFLVGDAMAPGANMKIIGADEIKAITTGRDILFATHGFNVSYSNGLLALGRLQDALELPSRMLFIGILWPGDFWIPAINYPWEASDAVRCGNYIADWYNRDLMGTASVSFISHSLGGRLILQAATRTRKVKMLCLTAAAVDDDVLTSKQYAAAYANCERVYVLSSRCDQVLKLAYPVGDFLSDIFGDKDSPFKGALGRNGPKPIPGDGRAVHDPILKAAGYDHGDYMPSKQTKWPKVAEYMRAAILGQEPLWP